MYDRRGRSEVCIFFSFYKEKIDDDGVHRIYHVNDSLVQCCSSYGEEGWNDRWGRFLVVIQTAVGRAVFSRGEWIASFSLLILSLASRWLNIFKRPIGRLYYMHCVHMPSGISCSSDVQIHVYMFAACCENTQNICK